MQRTFGMLAALLAGCVVARSQAIPDRDAPQPIYRITVVSRTLQAVNYEHRGGPTPIDFQGTVLMPNAKGQAIVESKRGRVEIDVHLDHLEAPTKFGPEYLTYVLWAITPEGRAKNLGEILVNSSNKAKTLVTTDMQAFGLIVTAEPYYSVSQPSDVVVMENLVRPDTIGSVEPVTARYELLPRGQYTLNLRPNSIRTAGAAEEKLPYDQYEAVLEIYQAQNAIQIAQSLNADRFAPDTMAKARQLLQTAQDYRARKLDSHSIVSSAREAAQMAEDARRIAVSRRGEIRAAQASEQAAQAQAAQAEAVADAQRATAEAAAQQAALNRAQVEAERVKAEAEAERERAIADRNLAQAQIPPPPPREADRSIQPGNPDLRRTRMEVLGQLNPVMRTVDTPRGIVVMVSDDCFDPSVAALRPEFTERMARVAAVIVSHPGVLVRVEGYMDDHGDRSERLSRDRADAVRQELMAHGVLPGNITAEGFGSARPVDTNATPAGRERNRRVEIVITGDPIGQTATWDRPYTLKPR